MSAPVVEPELLARAVDLLRGGGLVAFPTETVYGLGADAANAQAIERLFAVKGRPADHPVIVHGADAGVLDTWGRDVSDVARRLAGTCWPGPLTIVVRRAPHVLDGVTGGLDAVGVRVPDQPIALALLHAFGGGVAAPSANRFGRVSPTMAADVRGDLEDDVDLVLDGGPCTVGVESTIVDCSTDELVLLRPGGIPIERVRAIAACEVRERRAGDQRAPGALASHYAPRARVELVEREMLTARARALDDAGEVVGVIALGVVVELPARVQVLGTPVDVTQYARELYARLREADTQGVSVVLAVPPPEEGVGTAVVDRLQRAAGGVVESEP